MSINPRRELHHHVIWGDASNFIEAYQVCGVCGTHTSQSTRTLAHSWRGLCTPPPPNACVTPDPPFPTPFLGLLLEFLLLLIALLLLEPFLELVLEGVSQPHASGDASLGSCVPLVRQRAPPSATILLPLSPRGFVALTILREACLYACRGIGEDRFWVSVFLFLIILG